MQHHRNLIHTGVMRGKKLVVLMGERKALATAPAGKQMDRRWSKLKGVARLAGYLGFLRWQCVPMPTTYDRDFMDQRL